MSYCAREREGIKPVAQQTANSPILAGLYHHLAQEFVIQLGQQCDVTKIKTITTNGAHRSLVLMAMHTMLTLFPTVRSLTIMRCEGSSPMNWEKVLEMGEFVGTEERAFFFISSTVVVHLHAEVSDTDGQLQTEKNNVRNARSTFLKFQINSGWGDYSTVHTVSVDGSPGDDR